MSNKSQTLPPNIAAYFEENWYLNNNPDVLQALENGLIPSAFSHFQDSGFAEERAGFQFDRDWYLRSYPLVQSEIKSGLVSSPMDHFVQIGSARGYLPHQLAKRPKNAARMEQQFGGLWIDAPNARDMIEGKQEIGLITREEAELLRQFWANGYVVLDQAIPSALLEESRDALNRAYEGGFADLLFECHSVSREHIRWKPKIDKLPAKALDIHMFSNAVRNLIFAPAILRFLGLLFESLPLASQTLGFFRGSGQDAHQDSAFVPYGLARQFAASWIALEDVSPGAGELFYYKGSHRLEDFLYGGQFKSAKEASRSGIRDDLLEKMITEHVASLVSRAENAGFAKERFQARGGDVLIWHADLVHGGLPVSSKATRKSLVTHYCSKFHVPLFMEGGKFDVFQHDCGSFFASEVYPEQAPISVRSESAAS